MAIVGGAAVYYGISLSNQGTWASVGGWAIIVLYFILALIGGTVVGLLNAAQQVVTEVERAMRELLHAFPSLRTNARSDRTAPVRGQQDYEAESWSTC